MAGTLAITTGRLQLRWLKPDDASFIQRLVNDSDWLRFIGDKGVTDLDSARRYIESGPLAMYREHGFGLNHVALKRSDQAIGICGILRRPGLEAPDIGFALLPEFRRQGYALEAAGAVLVHARERLGIGRIDAIVNPENTGSLRLLERLGFVRAGEYAAEAGAPLLDLYSHAPDSPPD